LVLKQTSNNPVEFRRPGVFSRNGWEESVSAEKACEIFAGRPLVKLLESEVGDGSYTQYTVTIL